MAKFVMNDHALAELLNDPDGMVGKELERRAINVENRAKQNATGARVEGANNPESRGPNVDTGRLRSSITHELTHNSKGQLVARIGTNVEYARHLELGLRGGYTYPFLVPALEAGRE